MTEVMHLNYLTAFEMVIENIYARRPEHQKTRQQKMMITHPIHQTNQPVDNYQMTLLNVLVMKNQSLVVLVQNVGLNLWNHIQE